MGAYYIVPLSFDYFNCFSRLYHQVKSIKFVTFQNKSLIRATSLRKLNIMERES